MQGSTLDPKKSFSDVMTTQIPTPSTYLHRKLNLLGGHTKYTDPYYSTSKTLTELSGSRNSDALELEFKSVAGTCVLKLEFSDDNGKLSAKATQKFDLRRRFPIQEISELDTAQTDFIITAENMKEAFDRTCQILISQMAPTVLDNPHASIEYLSTRAIYLTFLVGARLKLHELCEVNPTLRQC